MVLGFRLSGVEGERGEGKVDRAGRGVGRGGSSRDGRIKGGGKWMYVSKLKDTRIYAVDGTSRRQHCQRVKRLSPTSTPTFLIFSVLSFLFSCWSLRIRPPARPPPLPFLRPPKIVSQFESVVVLNILGVWKGRMFMINGDFLDDESGGLHHNWCQNAISGRVPRLSELTRQRK